MHIDHYWGYSPERFGAMALRLFRSALILKGCDNLGASGGCEVRLVFVSAVP